MTEQTAEPKIEVPKTMKETKPEEYKKLQVARRQRRTQKRESYKKNGHKLGSKNRKCKLCGKVTTDFPRSEERCTKVKP